MIGESGEGVREDAELPRPRDLEARRADHLAELVLAEALVVGMEARGDPIQHPSREPNDGIVVARLREDEDSPGSQHPPASLQKLGVVARVMEAPLAEDRVEARVEER